MAPPEDASREPDDRDHELEEVIERNVRTVTRIRADATKRFGLHTHLIARMSHRLGRPLALYILVLGIGAWIAWNLLVRAHGGHPLDPPPFYWLEGFASVAALVASITILIGQNRQAELSERRAEFELQVNLLAAQRTAKLIALIEELRRDLPNVRDREDNEAEKLARAESPHAVANAVSRAMTHLEKVSPTKDIDQVLEEGDRDGAAS